MKLLPKPIIHGSKGGKGKGARGGSKEYDNTLRSRARAQIVELLSEGEIEGLVDGDKSIFFDETPLKNQSGSYNFKGMTWEDRKGLPDQAHLNGVPYVQTPIAVGVQVKKSESPPIRTITDENADAIRVIMRIPALTKQANNGDLKPTDVAYAIDIRPYGGSWQNAVVQTITQEKCVSPYQKAHKIKLPPGGHPWDVRVRRITDDSDTIKLQNETWWDSIVVLVEGKFTYPNSALIYMDIDAEQFGERVPDRYYHIRGIKCLVPTNYNPITREYTGIWNGTFKKAWTNNPAWILYDLITNDRYGLGEFVDVNTLDKWSLYQIGRYCDELVPSGFKDENGEIMEPRFTFNGVINSRDEAFKVLQNIATSFRGMLYWALGQVFATCDMPADPQKLVTPSNVRNGYFSYSGTALKARHSVAVVYWNDPNDFDRSIPEIVVNDAMLLKYGWRETRVQTYGCRSRGQAHRFGKWILDSEQYETETVEYEASWDHADLMPGQIIAIADPAKANAQTGGRIVGFGNPDVPPVEPDDPVDTAYVQLDREFTPSPGKSYQLMAVLPDGSIETRNIISWHADNTVRLNIAFSKTPLVGAQWIIKGTDVQPRLYRVLNVTETEQNVFKVTALFHDPQKYDRVENGIVFDPIYYTKPQNTIAAPTNFSATETRWFDSNGLPRTRITLSWTPGSDFMSSAFIVAADTPDGRKEYGQTTAVTMDIDATQSGDYTFYVTAISKTGRLSETVSITTTISSWEGTDAPEVDNLMVDGGSTTTFNHSNCRIVWENKFPGTGYATGDDMPDQNHSPFYRHNQVQVFDGATNQLLRSEIVQGTSYTYTIEMNAADSAVYSRPPTRSLKFTVTLVDTLGRTSLPKTISVTNPVPPTITPEVLPAENSVRVSFAIPATLMDYAGCMVWCENNSTFNPATTPPKYDGPNNMVQIPMEAGLTAFVRVALYDDFSKDGLNVSGIVTAVPVAAGIDTTPPGPPTGLTLEGVGFDAAYFSWTPPSDEDFFAVELWYNTINSFTGATYGGAYAGDAGALTGLEVGKTYYVFATAIDGVGNRSTNTPSVSVTVRKLLGDEIAPVTIDTSHIAAGAINTDKIANGAISTDKIANGAINGVKIATNAVDGTKIADGSISTPKLQDGAISTDKIANGAINGVKIANSAITAVKIEDNAITAGKISANAVTADHIAANAVTADKIAANAVTAGKLAANSVEAVNIAAGAVTAGKIAADAVTANAISAGAITSDKIAANAVVAENIAANAIVSDKIAANAITAGKIAAGAVEADKIAANAITAGKIAANAVEAANIASNAITADKILAGAITADKMNVTTLSSIAANVGTVTAGILRSSDGKFEINLTNKTIRIEV